MESRDDSLRRRGDVVHKYGMGQYGGRSPFHTKESRSLKRVSERPMNGRSAGDNVGKWLVYKTQDVKSN